VRSLVLLVYAFGAFCLSSIAFATGGIRAVATVVGQANQADSWERSFVLLTFGFMAVLVAFAAYFAIKDRNGGE
jgi:hypothetical protein